MDDVQGPQLRPLSTTEIWDSAWSLFMKRPMLMLGCVSAGTLPVVLLSLGYVGWLGTVYSGSASGTFEVGTTLWAFGMASLWGWHSITRGVATQLALDLARGVSPDPLRSWRDLHGSRWRVACHGTLALAAGGFGLAAFVIPGVLTISRWFPARCALIDERLPLHDAIHRAKQLTEGHRGRTVAVWLQGLLLYGLMGLNFQLLAGFLLSHLIDAVGLDSATLSEQLSSRNLLFNAWTSAAVFLLVEPVRCSADAVLYLDLKVRREGADLQQRLTELSVSRASGERTLLAALGAVALCFAAIPATAMPYESYRAEIRRLAEQAERGIGPGTGGRRISKVVVQQPSGFTGTVDNSWLLHGAPGLTQSQNILTLDRLQAPEGTYRAAGPLAPEASASDPRKLLDQILAQPEFRPLEERSELSRLGRTLTLDGVERWWSGFQSWLRKTVFRPGEAPKAAASNRASEFSGLEPIVYGIVLILSAYILVLLLRALMDRTRVGKAVRGAVTAAPLQASLTENALDHQPEQWREFAEEWRRRGEDRDALRSIYLALLSALHRRRSIRYDRTLTNWTYVREFKGDEIQREALAHLTRSFDEVWYGDRPCDGQTFEGFAHKAAQLEPTLNVNT